MGRRKEMGGLYLKGEPIPLESHFHTALTILCYLFARIAPDLVRFTIQHYEEV